MDFELDEHDLLYYARHNQTSEVRRILKHLAHEELAALYQACVNLQREITMELHNKT